MLLKGKKIVLGVTGGIAVYKAVDLVSRLRKQGAEVRRYDRACPAVCYAADI